MSFNGRETLFASESRRLGTGNLKGVRCRFEESDATFAVGIGVDGADFEVVVLLSDLTSIRV